MKRIHKRLLSLAIVFFVLYICITLYFNNVVYNVIAQYASAKADEMTVTAVNKAIMDVICDGIKYDELIKVEKDNNGKVTMLQADTVKINQIAQNTATRSINEFNNIGEQILKIPIGSLTNSPLFTGYGPEIHVKIMSAGNVKCSFKSVFDSAGINQTRHRIIIEVRAHMDIVLPAASKNIDSVIEIFITESIIVGEIPQTYLNIGSIGGYDFVPK